jgi:REP element-mobilizing transposase RayT
VAREFQPFDPRGEFHSYQGNLPHWRQPGSTYFVTFRLGDSLPAEKLRALSEERHLWLKARGLESEAELSTLSPAEQAQYRKHFDHCFHQWLDQGFGGCVLRQTAIAEIVATALLYFDGDRYSLDAFVIMPNHVHAVVRPSLGHPLPGILHSWKSFTAGKINRSLGSSGSLWQSESYDRLVRDGEELERWRQYISLNPEKAHLPEGAFILGCGSGTSTGSA